MAITSAFQADDAGSIPATRSRETSLIAALVYFYCVGTVFYLSSGYGSKPVIVTVLIFLRQQNGALSVEILYFLTGSVMHHSGVVKAPQRCSSVRGWFR